MYDKNQSQYTGSGWLIAKVLELEWLLQIRATYQRHHALQVVARFTGHAHFIAMDLRLDLQLTVFNQLDDFLRLDNVDTLL